MSKKSFILMRDLLGTVDLMTDEEAGKILKAIINHVDGEPFDLPRELVFAFSPIKNQLDRDMSKYDNYVEKQRLNGLKGGRPKKANPNPENPSLILGTQAKPKNLVTVNDTVTVTDNGTDTVNDIKEKKPKKPSPPKIEKPEGVEEQVWQDWLTLRKQKKAAVTITVLKGATREAGKAGVSLNEFLEIWCRRGSQGLEASWIKPDEKAKSPERSSRRENIMAFVHGDDKRDEKVIEGESYERK